MNYPTDDIAYVVDVMAYTEPAIDHELAEMKCGCFAMKHPTDDITYVVDDMAYTEPEIEHEQLETGCVTISNALLQIVLYIISIYNAKTIIPINIFALC